MKTWLVWTTGDEDPWSGQAEAAFVLPGGFLAIGDDESPSVFRPVAIFAPGWWMRAYQVPLPSEREVVGQ